MRSWIRDHPLAFAVIGVLMAIAGTTVLDAVGFGINVLPLIPLFFVLWYLQRFSRLDVGVVWGRRRDYVLAVLYPVLVLALIGAIAWLSGAAKLLSVNWAPTLLNLAAQIAFTAVFAIVTEEGIFRGWLWAALRRAGVPQLGVLIWTSVAFAAWHVSTALLPTAFHPTLGQVPIYILNAGAIGFVWAQMRERSGSIVVTSVSHGFWNGLVYALFGYGTTVGLLGVHNTTVFGPEIGVIGLAINVLFGGILWLTHPRVAARQGAPATSMP